MDVTADGRNDALADGRRIYLGNLHYVLKSEDIEEFLIANGFDDIENIHMSIDAVSNRNPGYCFVDFAQRATAERALTSLQASLRGREIKVGPCEPRKKRNENGRSGFQQRTGDWRGAPAGEDAQQYQNDQRPRGGFNRSEEVVDESQGKRLYVGGLAKMGDQDQNNQEVMGIFTGFNPSYIGKRIAPMTAPEALLEPTTTALLTLRPRRRPKPPCRPLMVPHTMEACSRFHWPRETTDSPPAPTRHRIATARDVAGHAHPTPDPRADCRRRPGPWDPTTGGSEMLSR
ncbi:hypothetical protein ACSS6W_006015 [Trichoderma asperelloides]